MSAVYQVKTPPIGMQAGIQSIRYWLWPSVTDRSAELPYTAAGFQQCHYLEFEGWSGKNANGTLLHPLDHIDTRTKSVFEYFGADVNQADAIDQLLLAAFPDPGAP